MDPGKKLYLFSSWPLRLFPTSAYIIQSKKGKVLSKVENVHEIAKDFIKLLKKWILAATLCLMPPPLSFAGIVCESHTLKMNLIQNAA